MVDVVAFGACARQDEPQPIWDAILAADPDLFLFLGDTIYSKAETAAGLAAEYARLAAKPGFARLRATVPILATWDDHEYGIGDGGADHPHKARYERAFLDFFGVPEQSVRRARPGVYHATVFGPPGRRVQVILLDTRSFRSPLRRRPGGETEEQGRYVPSDDPNATLLGDEQWRWLQVELRRPADLRLLVSSIQVLTDEHGWEKWGNLPAERRRLLRTIRDSGARGVVILSGDRHLGEIAVLPPDDPDGVGYPLIEVTTGGLTHGTGLPQGPNRYRVASEEFYREPNFGLLTIDWEDGPTLTFQIRDLEGDVVIEHLFNSKFGARGAL